MKESILPHFKGSASTDTLFRINDNVSLHVFEFTPYGTSKNIPIVMITGLVTMIDSFRTVVEGLAESYKIIYIETRDKSTSRINGKVAWDIATIAGDVASVIKEKIPSGTQYVMLGFSLGGPVIAECFSLLPHKPCGLIFMEPTAEFDYPRWSLFLIRRMSLPYHKVNAFLAKTYLRMTRINASEDQQMMEISSHSIDNADPFKLRSTILAIAGYKIYDSLEVVSCPCLVVGTSKDTFHSAEGMKKMVALLENARYVDLVTNERTHSMEMVDVTNEFITHVTQQSAGK